MKKSKILKQVLAHFEKKERYRPLSWCDSSEKQAFINPYICNVIKDIGIRAERARTQDNCEALVDWIELSLGNVPHVSNRGVAAWLYAKRWITRMEMENSVRDERFMDYRAAWVKNMIEYWEAQGQ